LFTGASSFAVVADAVRRPLERAIDRADAHERIVILPIR
jgi:hypothetical protein